MELTLPLTVTVAVAGTSLAAYVSQRRKWPVRTLPTTVDMASACAATLVAVAYCLAVASAPNFSLPCGVVVMHRIALLLMVLAPMTPIVELHRRARSTHLLMSSLADGRDSKHAVANAIALRRPQQRRLLGYTAAVSFVLGLISLGMSRDGVCMQRITLVPEAVVLALTLAVVLLVLRMRRRFPDLADMQHDLIAQNAAWAVMLLLAIALMPSHPKAGLLLALTANLLRVLVILALPAAMAIHGGPFQLGRPRQGMSSQLTRVKLGQVAALPKKDSLEALLDDQSAFVFLCLFLMRERAAENAMFVRDFRMLFKHRQPQQRSTQCACVWCADRKPQQRARAGSPPSGFLAHHGGGNRVILGTGRRRSIQSGPKVTAEASLSPAPSLPGTTPPVGAASQRSFASPDSSEGGSSSMAIVVNSHVDGATGNVLLDGKMHADLAHIISAYVEEDAELCINVSYFLRNNLLKHYRTFLNDPMLGADMLGTSMEMAYAAVSDLLVYGNLERFSASEEYKMWQNEALNRSHVTSSSVTPSGVDKAW